MEKDKFIKPQKWSGKCHLTAFTQLQTEGTGTSVVPIINITVQ